MSRTFFGTDGIRGRVGQYPITADFIPEVRNIRATCIGSAPMAIRIPISRVRCRTESATTP